MAIEKRREYHSYKEYKKHQKEKTSSRVIRRALKNNFSEKVEIFQKRFQILKDKDLLEDEKKCICLGSRMGEEVVAFKNLGVDAIGVDLVPYLPNVIEADFHHLPFEDSTFDIAYSNSFDHTFDADMFFKSVERVLKVGGLFVLDIFPGMFGSHEVTHVDSADDVKNAVCKNWKFELVETFTPLPNLYPRLRGQDPNLVQCVELVFRKV
jgi:SAM-dependent methyltransferase